MTLKDLVPGEFVTCGECGSEPGSYLPVAHKPECSRMTIAPHLWPSPVSAPEGDRP